MHRLAFGISMGSTAKFYAVVSVDMRTSTVLLLTATAEQALGSDGTKR